MTLEQRIEQAHDKGREHGANAGEWYFDGNSSEESYSIILRGIEDGDPAILDTFPVFSFGEWAGESISELLHHDATDEEIDAYLQGFDEGCADMIESTARAHTRPSDNILGGRYELDANNR